MVSKEQNERLTHVGPGTPMGELLRRYWHPIAVSTELEEEPTKEIRLLGEDLVLYKDLRGRYGLIDRYCAHRRVDLTYGMPEENGLRCMYHGWMYDATGQCIEQPFEETVHPDGRFKQKVKLQAYPVQELGGLIFAYLGPQPAPLLPRWELLTMEGAVLRETFIADLPCNWLQCMENSVDPVHLEWLHGYYGYYLEQRGLEKYGSGRRIALSGRHRKIAFEVFEHGIIKRRVWSTGDEKNDTWVTGHPLLFPNILQQGGRGKFILQFRVPKDDHNTWHLEFAVFILPPQVSVPKQEHLPVTHYPLYNERGRLIIDDVLTQDHAAWLAQGIIPDRRMEHLGESDKGIILYRKLLEEQVAVVQDGGDPLGTIRDPGKNERLSIPQEGWHPMHPDMSPNDIGRSRSKLKDQILQLLAEARESAAT